VRPPAVVPAFKFAAQVGQMINTLDDGYPLKPFVFEGLVDSFGNGNGAVFADGPQTMLYVMALQQFSNSPVKTWAWSEMRCLGDPYFSMALSKALLIQPALGPSRGTAAMTLREKWSMITQM